MNNPRMLAAIVLAAGASVRFGSPKQRILLPLVLERLGAAGSLADVVVVLGAHEVEVSARTVRCPDWSRGPGASLRCGLEALRDDVSAAVVVLADGPTLAPAAIDRLAEVWCETGAPILAASYAGERGHPVLLARPVWSKIPDEGARGLAAVLVPCDDLGSPGDVDHADDLESGSP